MGTELLVVYFVGLFFFALLTALVVGEDNRETTLNCVVGCLFAGSLWPLLVVLILVAVPMHWFNKGRGV